ncbi:MAG: ferritin family protein [Nitrospinales bacterium]
MTKPQSNLPDISFQCLDAIKVNISIEKEGLHFYEKAIKNIKNEKVKEFFVKLVAEEKEHIDLLEEKARFLQPVLSGKSSFNNQVDTFISKELKGKVFPSAHKRDHAFDLASIKDDVQALEFGIEAEKRSIGVLTHLLSLERKIDVKAIFSHLIAEEKKHLAGLEKLKQQISDKPI